MRKKLAVLYKLIREFVHLSTSLSVKYAFCNLLWWICFYFRTPFSWKLSSWAIHNKTVFLDKYIEKKYNSIIQKYNCNQNYTKIIDFPIWFFWGQGENNMPLLVKACYNQLLQNHPNVHLVTEGNLGSWAQFPSSVFEKVKTNRLSWANYSDIIRNALLSNYGGLWIDSTVWVPTALPLNEISSHRFYSANGKVPVTSKSICFWTSGKWNWSTWCMSTNEKNNKLFSFVYEMLLNMALDERVWPDYVIQDYLIHYACRRWTDIQEMVENMRLNNLYRNELASLMNSAYDKQHYDDLLEKDFMFKLSYRTNWIERTAKGELTYYGKLIANAS